MSGVPVGDWAMETVLEEREEVAMPVVLVEEKIASSVQQQSSGRG